jgi:dienelactone hydrolase
MRYSVYFFIAAFLLWGCHGKPSSTNGNTISVPLQHAGAPFKLLRKGIVLDSVICSDDSSQIYAVYLPTHYDTAKKWPIIYFFDPHGVGNLPVKLYKDLAEKYGFILAGTYNSKNGMQWETSEKAAEAFMKDTWLRLSIDNNRSYTFGFSGGAKVASMVAIADGGIAGVVACGGGFPEQHPPLKQPFSFISFVGDKDFNNVTVRQLDKLLDSTNLAHQLIVFNGKHQWPPVSIAEEAFQWLDADAMRMKTMPKNDSIIKSIRETMLKEAGDWHKKRNPVEEYYTYKKLLNFLRDLDDLGKYAAMVQQFENSDAIEKNFKDEETFEAEEAQEILEFRAHLSKMDEAWWENKVSIMKKRIQKDTTSPAALQTQRMLGYLSLVMYMGASNELNGGNIQAATYFNGLYALVDPANPEHCYINATLFMASKNSGKALEQLREAVKLGFTDSKRLESDSYFESLHNSPEYKTLLKEMASKPEKLDMTK